MCFFSYSIDMVNKKSEPLKILRTRVLTSIRQEERRRARAYLFVSAGIAVASSVGVLVSIIYLGQELVQSSLGSYLALIFSDTDVVLAYPQSFFFSLAEALPIFSTTVVLATTLLFLGSIRVFAGNIRVSFLYSFNK